MKTIQSAILLWLLLCFLMACAPTRRLAGDEVLYLGAKVKFRTDPTMDKDKIKRSLKELKQPEPNGIIFGLKPRLWIFNLVGAVEKDKGFKHWLKYKVGEPPVLLSSVDEQHIGRQMKNRMINKGYFHAEVVTEIHKRKEKTAQVIYNVQPGSVYTLQSIDYPDSTTHLTGVIRQQRKDALLKQGQRFELETMNRERTRIEQVLRDSGYFHFNRAHLIYEADSTVGDHEVGLELRLRSSIESRATRRYVISGIDILPGYSSDKMGRQPFWVDSMRYFFDREVIRARPVANAVRLNVGDYYALGEEDITMSRLSAMGVFKYINLNFEEDSSNATLHTRINLEPFKRKSLSVQVNAVTKSNNFVGPFVTASFMNRNFLGGAERFNLSLQGGFEAQLNRGQFGGVNSYEVGTEASLTVPRLIIPFHVNESDSKYDYSTRFSIGGRIQRRVNYFDLYSLDAMMGYRWNHKVIHRYEAFPMDVSLFRTTNTSQAFDEVLEDDPFLESTYQDQFILGGRYSYFYNSRSLEQPFEDPDDFFFNANINLSGNILRLVQEAFKKENENNSENAYAIGGLPYAQFSKLDVDFRYYRRLDRNNRLAFRLIAGAGYAYGNSTSMPYTHQFAIGGSNSIRAFSPRSIGPGEYSIPDSLIERNAFVDQTADIKLEVNLEYRFNLYKKLKGAVFVDAGNIWTARVQDTRPGGEFRWDKFYKQIAVGTGVGLRYDLDFLIVRLDVGMPLRVPDRPEGDRWVFDEIAVDKGEWRRQNLVFNIAIGYPF